jgi:hypothetical protein
MLLLYAAGLFSTYPWLSPYANFVDCTATLSLLFFCAMASWFSEKEAGLESSVSSFILVNSFLPLIFALGAGAVLLYRRTSEQVLAAAAKRSAFAVGFRETATLLGSVKQGAFEEFIARLSLQDLDALKAARQVVQAELLGQQLGSQTLTPWTLLEKRLVLSKEPPSTEEKPASAMVDV